MKSIKVYTKSQLVLLRNINSMLGRYKVPREIIKQMDYILEEEVLGVQGFLIVLLNPVRDDIREIEDTVNVYPLEIEFRNDLKREEIKDLSCEIARDREWYLNKVSIKGTDSQVCVLYSIMKKHLDKRD